jgi:hypothetical protein
MSKKQKTILWQGLFKALFESAKNIALKGKCHEINNLFKVLKNKISTYISTDDFFLFFASLLFRKILLNIQKENLTVYGLFYHFRPSSTAFI